MSFRSGDEPYIMGGIKYYKMSVPSTWTIWVTQVHMKMRRNGKVAVVSGDITITMGHGGYIPSSYLGVITWTLQVFSKCLNLIEQG